MSHTLDLDRPHTARMSSVTRRQSWPGAGPSETASDTQPRGGLAAEPADASGLGGPVVSVVIPVMNEAENVGPLLAEITDAFDGQRQSYEVIFVDDCSTDGTDRVLVGLREAHPELRILRHQVNCGQSAALRTGIWDARGTVIVTMDGDGQNDPADAPALLAHLLRPDAGQDLRMVAGRRRKRQDNVTKRLASSAANGIRSRLLQDGAADTGCGLKVFYRESFLRLPFFDHMHRFIPALMHREGFAMEFLDVSHRPRTHGRSKYGVFDRLLVSVSDVLGVMWLNRRCRRPGPPSVL